MIYELKIYSTESVTCIEDTGYCDDCEGDRNVGLEPSHRAFSNFVPICVFSSKRI